MKNIAWLDFSRHNEQTSEEIRAYAANLPTGRLMILRGVAARYTPQLEAEGFIRISNGDWVSDPKTISHASLQQKVFPSLQVSQQDVNTIDITREYEQTNLAKETITASLDGTHPIINWLFINTKQSTETPAVQRFDGLVPAGTLATLTTYLEDNKSAVTTLASGTTVYTLQAGNQHIQVSIKPRLQGKPDRLEAFFASTLDALPKIEVPNKPAIYVLADALELNTPVYTWSRTSKDLKNHSLEFEYTVSKHQATLQAEQALLEGNVGEAFLVETQVKGTVLPLSTRAFDTKIASSELRVLFKDNEEFEAFRASAKPSEIDETVDDPIYDSELLAKNSLLISAARRAGFDNIAYYRNGTPEKNSGPENNNVDREGIALALTPLTQKALTKLTAAPIANPTIIPEGYEVIQGKGPASGKWAIRHIGRDERISNTATNSTGVASTWFSSVARGVKQIPAQEEIWRQPTKLSKQECKAALNAGQYSDEAVHQLAPTETLSEKEAIAYLKDTFGKSENTAWNIIMSLNTSDTGAITYDAITLTKLVMNRQKVRESTPKINETPTVILSPSDDADFIRVTGKGLSFIERDILILEGRFNDNISGYELPAISEEGVRNAIRISESLNEINLDERIRRAQAIEIDTPFLAGDNKQYVLTDVSKAEDDDIRVRISEHQSGHDLVVRFSNYRLENLESRLGISITNKDALRAIAKPPQHEPEPPQKPTPTSPKLSVSEAPQTRSTPVKPEAFISKRGKVWEFIGNNIENDRLYVATDSNLRLTLNDENDALFENFFVSPEGEFTAQADRSKLFQLHKEIASDLSVFGNTAGAAATTQREMQIDSHSLEEFEDWLNQVNIQKALPELVAAKSLVDESKNQDRFSQNRHKNQFESALDRFHADLASSGYTVNQTDLFNLLDLAIEKRREMIDATVSRLSTVLLHKSMQQGRDQSDTPSLKSLLGAERDELSIMSGDWIADQLAQLRQTNDDLRYTLITALYYGTAEEIQQAQEAGYRVANNLSDSAPLIAIEENLDRKYGKQRSLFERSVKIETQRRFIVQYDGRSTIPLDHAWSQIHELYDEIAEIQYDLSTREVTDADIEAYEKDIESDAIVLAKHLQMSVSAARVFSRKIGAENSKKRLLKFQGTGEFKAVENAIALLGENPNTERAELDTGSSMIGIKSPYGLGEVNMSFPESVDEGYKVSFGHTPHRESASFNANRSVTYPSLPTAEQLSEDFSTLVNQYNAKTNTSTLPIFGEKFSLDDDDRYNMTEMASRVRSQIKTEIKAGHLPKGLKVGVRKGPTNIALTIKNPGTDTRVYSDEFLEYRKVASLTGDYYQEKNPPRYSRDGATLIHALSKIANAWNRKDNNEHEQRFDKNYTVTVSVDNEILQSATNTFEGLKPSTPITEGSFDERGQLESLGFTYRDGVRASITPIHHDQHYQVSYQSPEEPVVTIDVYGNKKESINAAIHRLDGALRTIIPTEHMLNGGDIETDEIISDKEVQTFEQTLQQLSGSDKISDITHDLEEQLATIEEELKSVATDIGKVELEHARTTASTVLDIVKEAPETDFLAQFSHSALHNEQQLSETLIYNLGLANAVEKGFVGQAQYQSQDDILLCQFDRERVSISRNDIPLLTLNLKNNAIEFDAEQLGPNEKVSLLNSIDQSFGIIVPTVSLEQPDINVEAQSFTNPLSRFDNNVQQVFSPYDDRTYFGTPSGEAGIFAIQSSGTNANNACFLTSIPANGHVGSTFEILNSSSRYHSIQMLINSLEEYAQEIILNPESQYHEDIKALLGSLIDNEPTLLRSSALDALEIEKAKREYLKGHNKESSKPNYLFEIETQLPPFTSTHGQIESYATVAQLMSGEWISGYRVLAHDQSLVNRPLSTFSKTYPSAGDAIVAVAKNIAQQTNPTHEAACIEMLSSNLSQTLPSERLAFTAEDEIETSPYVSREEAEHGLFLEGNSPALSVVSEEDQNRIVLSPLQSDLSELRYTEHSVDGSSTDFRYEVTIPPHAESDTPVLESLAREHHGTLAVNGINKSLNFKRLQELNAFGLALNVELRCVDKNLIIIPTVQLDSSPAIDHLHTQFLTAGFTPVGRSGRVSLSHPELAIATITVTPGLSDTLSAQIKTVSKKGIITFSEQEIPTDNTALSSVFQHLNNHFDSIDVQSIFQDEDFGERLTPEQQAGTLSEIGINIERQDNGYKISGNTFMRRAILKGLNAEFHKVKEKKQSHWTLDYNPTEALANQITANGITPETVNADIGAFNGVLTTTPSGFAYRFNHANSDQTIYIGQSDSLVATRRNILGLDENDVAKIWNQETGEQFDVSIPERSKSRNALHDKPATSIEANIFDMAVEDDDGRNKPIPNIGNGATDRKSRVDIDPGIAALKQLRELSEEHRNSKSNPANNRGSDQRTDHSDRGVTERRPFDYRAALSEYRDQEQDQDTPKISNIQRTVAALSTLLQLRKEQRPADPSEQKTLSHMVGLGAKDFAEKRHDNIWVRASNIYSDRGRLTELLRKFSTPDRQALKDSIVSSFNTPESIGSFMWDALVKMGLPTDSPIKINEPAVGTGHLIGLAPEGVRKNAELTSVEINPVASEICQHLYPEITTITSPYEKLTFAGDSFDAVIGNPPYGDIRTFNPNTKKRELIHDMFLQESIRILKPGGLLAFVTSAGTLDKSNRSVRTKIAKTADLITAFRLPSTAFEEAGTEVITDVLLFRSRFPEEEPLLTNWVDTEIISLDDSEERINSYFVANPDNVLGQLTVRSGRYGNEISVMPKVSSTLEEQFHEALKKVPENVYSAGQGLSQHRKTQPLFTESTIPSEIIEKNPIGSFVQTKNNDVGILAFDVENSVHTLLPISNKNTALLASSYIELRDATKAVLDSEAREINADRNELFVDAQRKTLNQRYDTFVNTYGFVNLPTVARKLRADPSFYIVAALENFDAHTLTSTKADIFTQRVLNAEVSQPHVDSTFDAVNICFNESGYIDPERVATLLSINKENALEAIDEFVIQDPETGKLQITDLYLSGNIHNKLETAEKALLTDTRYEKNIRLLHDAMPTKIPLNAVNIAIGQTWIPTETYSRFARHILKVSRFDENKCHVVYNDALHIWTVKATPGARASADIRNTTDFGTHETDFPTLFKALLEQKQITVRQKDPHTGETSINEVETAKSRLKQDEISREFSKWVYSKEEMVTDLEQRYNDRFNSWVEFQPSGDAITVRGATNALYGKPFSFQQHQSDVIARSIIQPSGLLIAHEAGAGKTIEQAAIAFKYKDLKMATKPIVAIPNHMLVQFTLETLSAFPGRKVLTVTHSDLTPSRRKLFAQKIAMNDWDLVICTHEQFKSMSLSPQLIEDHFDGQLADYKDTLYEARKSGDRLNEKQMVRAVKNMESKLEAQLDKITSQQDPIFFDELGIDMVLYDEAHYLKNYAFPTKLSAVAGVNTSNSARATDAFMKFEYLRQMRGDNKGVVLATGTPISNTMGEMLVYLSYLAPDLLKDAGINHFDAFVAAFGEQVTRLEMKPDGGGYQLKNRLSRYHNIPELVKMFRQVADIKQGDDLNIQRPTVETKTHKAPKTELHEEFMSHLSCRLKAISSGHVDPSKDNALLVCNSGKLGAVDLRLIHPDLPDIPNSKLNQAVDNIFTCWENGEKDKRTQLVFLDYGVPNSKADLYNDMKSKWIEKGIPPSQIAFIHDAKNDDEKFSLFKRMREGDIRILIASTEKAGVGTNVQTRGSDVHHINIPWRAIDLEQRLKRFERQGCMFSSIKQHFYVTEDSFDICMLDKVNAKSKMTKQAYTQPDNAARTIDEDLEPTYEELMAITTSNPLIKDKVLADAKVEELRLQEYVHASSKNDTRRELSSLKSILSNNEKLLKENKESLNSIKKIPERFVMEIGGVEHTKPSDAAIAIYTAAHSLGPYKNTIDIGHYAGLRVSVIRSNQRYYLQLDLPTPRQVEINVEAFRFVTNFSKLVTNLPKDIQLLTSRIQTTKNGIEHHTDLLNEDFPKAQELTSAIADRLEINTALAKIQCETTSDNNYDYKNHPFVDRIDALDGQLPSLEEIKEMKEHQRTVSNSDLLDAIESIASAEKEGNQKNLELGPSLQ